MSRYVVVTTDPSFADRLALVATGVLSGEVHAWAGTQFPRDPHEVIAQLAHPAFLDVLVLGPGVPLDQAYRLAGEFETQRPDVAVLLVAPPTPEVLLAAIRAGIRDVVEPDSGPAEIGVFLHRAVRSTQTRRTALDPQARATSSRGRVIVVASPKGGVGKTTLATNISVGLAQQVPHGVVLVDLDFQFGDVATALSLVPEHSVHDAVHGPARQDTMVLKSFLSAHPTDLYALCAPPQPDAAESLTADHISHLLTQLAGEYRFVVVDTSPGLSDHTLAALDEATDVVLVSGIDVPSIRGMRKEIDVLNELQMIPSTRHMVLNNVNPRDGVTVKDARAALGVDVDCVVPSSRAVRLSTNQGVPLLQGRSKDAAARAMRSLVQRFSSPPAVVRRHGARHRVGT
ncbi:AAA family ATPase [Arthrobacter bussei]|uniref:AAA family ATPase n=1 Tax=Arthrobacter bussei TaxID=2594179 RepID=A0A7X1NMX0_9MICC|nr:AAA family ATPase [Arthrobacter bussei]MPY09811.1 AAA family ATPase [Arthrobacter bussei]